MSGWTEQILLPPLLMYTVNPISLTHQHTGTHAQEQLVTRTRSVRSNLDFLFFILYFGRFWLCGFLWKSVARLKIKHWHRSTFNVDKIYRFVRGFIDKIFKPRMKLKFTKIKHREKPERKLKEL